MNQSLGQGNDTTLRGVCLEGTENVFGIILLVFLASFLIALLSLTTQLDSEIDFQHRYGWSYCVACSHGDTR